MKYRDNMNTQELHKLCRQLAALDAAYEQAEKIDAAYALAHPMDAETLEAVEQLDSLRRAALNHRGQP